MLLDTHDKSHIQSSNLSIIKFFRYIDITVFGNKFSIYEKKDCKSA